MRSECVSASRGCRSGRCSIGVGYSLLSLMGGSIGNILIKGGTGENGYLTLAIMTTKKSFGLMLQVPISSPSMRTFPEWINFINEAGRSGLVPSYPSKQSSLS